MKPGPRVRQLRGWLRRFPTGWAGVLAAVLLLSACGGDGPHLSFLNPQGPVANAQRWHFYEVLTILAVLVAAPIFILTPLIFWRYRYGAKSPRYTPQWDFYRPLEIAVWGGPIVIVAVLSFFLWHYTHALDPYKPLASDQPELRIQVVGYDWKWLFIYPDQGIASIGMLAMPVGRPVAMKITSATVMQSLFIPALGSQIYAMGGMVTQLHLKASKPGRYLGENTMFSGRGFHQQKFTAVGMTPDDFKAWGQKVRAHGVPMNKLTLKAIAQRGTVAELIASMPQVDSKDGNVYLTGVTPALFPAVVRATATKGVTAVELVNASKPAAAVPARDAVTAKER